MSSSGDPACPANPTHGEMYSLRDGSDRFYCPHIEHVGRSKKNTAGELEPSQAFFTMAEVNAAKAQLG